MGVDYTRSDPDDMAPIMNILSFQRFFRQVFLPAGIFLLVCHPMSGSASSPQEQQHHIRVNGSPWQTLKEQKLKLRSESALVVDQKGQVVYSKQPDRQMPIASITKLMTAMVVLDAGVDLDTSITISKADRDLSRLTGSRLKYGKATLSRRNLLKIALMSSENRAASALGRTTYAAGVREFVAAMNRKARKLNMRHTVFVDSTGLDSGNVSSARDLVKLLRAAQGYPLIKQATTLRNAEVRPYQRLGPLRYANTNRLLKNENWDIGLSKTGYINESGRCLVMQARLSGSDLYIVLLNSFGKLTPFGDSNRLRKWIDQGLQE
jgi:D-alanyl-D-alanine endopeptidase (penicillin-binding protein 7)